MFNRNEDIRKAKGKIPKWVIAEKLGIHENTLNYWMRKNLSTNEKEKILSAINLINKEIENGDQYE